LKNNKTILLIDDEQSYLEALADALDYDGYRVLKARTAEEALKILSRERIDLVTIDIMLDPGDDLSREVESRETGLFLCREIRKKYPEIDAFCISVLRDTDKIREIESLGIRFLKKGTTPLRTVLNALRSRLTGIAYSSERDRHRHKK